jgi:hypothetical protein
MTNEMLTTMTKVYAEEFKSVKKHKAIFPSREIILESYKFHNFCADKL